MIFQGTEIQLGLALESQNATLSVKRRLACEAVSYYAQVLEILWMLPSQLLVCFLHHMFVYLTSFFLFQTLCCLSGDNNFHRTAKKHLLFIKWKYLEAKVFLPTKIVVKLFSSSFIPIANTYNVNDIFRLQLTTTTV